MSAAQRPASSVEALNDNELEILRLLTAGHTVKSIAVRLGRSEASINERLRDARRKTGVGSSRELARHLAAQKIWDKKIDLSTQASSNDEEAQRPNLGRAPSKGTIVMLIATSVAALGFAIATAGSEPADAPAPAAQVAAAQLPIVGKWSLDVSRLPAEGRPRRVTLDFRVSPDQVWTGRSEIVAADGSTVHAQATGPADGVPVALTGNMQFADMVSMRQPAPNTLVLTFTKDGSAVSTRVYTVEEGRQAMKETIVWAGDVAPRTLTTYFDRIG